jgi:hypothetical protein
MDWFVKHRFVLPPWEERRRLWYDGLEAEREVSADTAAIIQEALEGQLARARGLVNDADRKAALVIPGVGVLAGLFGTQVSPSVADNPAMSGLLLAIVAGAVMSVLAALLTLAPEWTSSNGPDTKLVSRATGHPPVAIRAALVAALGFAVHSTEEVALHKARYLAWAFRSGAVTVVLFVVFAGLGGLTP